ncbi:Motility protein B [Gemmata obscuriglobus]|uniref:flagellar motor protein MotB n=1 Tax=Gemmata obscuriglobus TaxID=114 RepID=UPI00016C550D|nr:flagellar motor protein MotB [Gemmata obscuriglobus]QEG29988.1 Motility protein B [Gemmata obscuriglobus]VTS09306.1 flagellar motor protein : Motility protein B, N-terminal domain protein OS=Gemmatimonadetes bacterium KBS708 GN=J421_0225 PE=4 SV=1: MotB_plug [Gemmata obscuriglobus UQM 2246]
MAKGGGSWKVAYADFVTAMMAFFLVMWIGAQDVKVRQSVANYFIDPAGVSKKPVSDGAVLETPSSGPVAGQLQVAGGRGTRVPSGGVPSPSTAAILNWINADAARSRHWKGEAQRVREAAAAQKAVNESRTPEEVEIAQLSQLLASDLAGTVPKDMPEVYKDLLFSAFKEVNWEQVAGTLLKD